MREFILILSVFLLTGCGLASTALNPNDLGDPRWEIRNQKIELAKTLIGSKKDDVVKIFGEPNPRNINNKGGKVPLIKGDPYENWIQSDEEWTYMYYENGIPLVNSFNYWVAFHFIDDEVIVVDY